MATTSFVANVNKTVTVEGILYTLTVPELPDGTRVYLNEVELTAGETVTLTDNMSLTVTAEPVTPASAVVTYTNMSSFQINGIDVQSGYRIPLNQGVNSITAVGATSIPQVTINGSGINNFSVNGFGHSVDELPYTFTPMGGQVNQVFMDGSQTEAQRIHIAGTNIASMTVNNQAVTLPYETYVSEPLEIAVSGEIYQVDFSSVGGAKIEQDGTVISDGTAPIHKIIDITKDTYFGINGTHNLHIDGTDIKSLSVNGVTVPVSSLPVNLQNVRMDAYVTVNGFEPSEVHVVGEYMDTVTVDGVNIPIGENGSVNFELTTVEQNHFINIIGSQPRPYGITFKDNGTTSIYMDGVKMIDGTVTYIKKDVFIEAEPEPLTLHFESPDNITFDINGKKYFSNDFKVDVFQDTEIDAFADTCDLTIDYGDNSYTTTVPQSINYVTAPHRDNWIFDGWSSSDVGIANPKSVKALIDLTQKSSAHLVCHYQRCITIDKPNMFN